MTRAAISSCAAALLAALVPDGTAQASEQACIAAVRWKGATYSLVANLKRVRLGPLLRGGQEPACRDQPGIAVPPPLGARLRAVRGVSPSVAVARTDRLNGLYLARGYFPALPDFPLHDAIYGSRKAPLERRWEGLRPWYSCDTLRTLRLTGTVTSAGWFGAFDLATGGQKLDIFTDVRTRVPHRPGRLPRIRGGDRLHVVATECRRGSRFRVVVADRILLPSA